MRERWTVALVALTAALSLAAGPATADPDFGNRQDFDFAQRGYVGGREDPKITMPDGRLVWDLSAYDFLNGPAPATANPSLWRQAQLLAKAGLFKVTDGVWQVRGFDLANATFVQGKTGWIVIDTLTSAEAAKAALDLVNDKLGKRRVVAMIYTHSHTDHFGGARGMIAQADVDAGLVKVIAPAGFMEAAVGENIIAGPAMARRATYQFGTFLPKGAAGQISAGIGQALSAGTQTLVPPNVSITRTGEELVIDGVRLQFQITPGTEAPAEMNIYLPDLKTLCMAENANATLHNVLTPRGAVVRDAKTWADYLSQSISLYGDKTDVMFTSHAWPRFGRVAIIDFLGKHRDAYKYLHDQSVRMMNAGLTGAEIANRLKLPPTLADEWYNRGYYGTMSFNSRAVYQRYMGWYDANPVHLAPLDPADESARYVTMMGGADSVLAGSRKAYDAGDDRWAGELANRLVIADRSNMAARELLAKVYDRQGQSAESSLWRNMYLSAALELRSGVQVARGAGQSFDLIQNTTTPMLLDLLSVRLNPEKAGAASVAIDLIFPDRKERFRLRVKNDVLTYEADPKTGKADVALTMPRASFLITALAGGDVKALLANGTIKADGDPAAYQQFLTWFDAPPGNFPIVWR